MKHFQKALSEYGAVIWTDTQEYFITSEMNETLKQAEETGIAAWPIASHEPTSAFTHPKMFEYFHTKDEHFYFHEMVGSNHLVLYNKKIIHKQLMRMWVQCALSYECLYPLGAQSRGCRNYRRPLFKYSRCHKSEVSALNVILGLIFHFDFHKYLTNNKIFGIEPEIDPHDIMKKSTEKPTPDS